MVTGHGLRGRVEEHQAGHPVPVLEGVLPSDEPAQRLADEDHRPLRRGVGHHAIKVSHVPVERGARR